MCFLRQAWRDTLDQTVDMYAKLLERNCKQVENDLRFSEHFLRPGERQPAADEVCSLLAAIFAHGCTLGLQTMEKIAPGIAYRDLRRISDWRLIEENQRAALAGIVHAISRLDVSQRWGEGRTSASDGQRFAMASRVLQRTYSTRFNDFALEFYSFVADNYAPFVLDGVLYHESDLDLEEHYTDTHGYTEINFAAFAMIGMRFCPRIRGVHRQRIYCADPMRDHGVLEPVLQRGRISAREVYDQMNACSCLTLILACVIYWQAREISRIAAAPDFPFDPELIARISPIEWRNIVLYGEINLDPSKLRARGP